MPRVFTSKNQRIGELGETIIVRFLMKHGYRIIERNYTKPWGEIDIIARKSKVLHFIEVKSVSGNLDLSASGVNVELDNYSPMDNMHLWKRKRLGRVIQTYLSSNNIVENTEWQIDLFILFMDFKKRKARVKVVKDIIL